MILWTVVVGAIVVLGPWSPVGWFGPHHIGDTQIQIKKMEEALIVYAAKHKGQFPERLEDARKYMPDGEVPVDAWGNPYFYVRADTPYLLVSLGADGKPGGEGEDADIRSDGFSE